MSTPLLNEVGLLWLDSLRNTKKSLRGINNGVSWRQNANPLVVPSYCHLAVYRRVHKSCTAFWLSSAGACLRRISHRPPMSRKWCHYDWKCQLRAYRWQDLWRRPLSDGKHRLPSSGRLQNHVTKVRRGDFIERKPCSPSVLNCLLIKGPCKINGQLLFSTVCPQCAVEIGGFFYKPKNK